MIELDVATGVAADQTTAATASMPNARPWRRRQAPKPRSGAPKAQGFDGGEHGRSTINRAVRRSRFDSTGAEAPMNTSDTSRIYTSLTDATEPPGRANVV